MNIRSTLSRSTLSRSTLSRSTLALALFVATATQLSCNVNEYCLNCARGDGGHDGDNGDGSGSADANDGGPCVPSAEVCDGKDNDCNGQIDDGVLPGVGDLCANQMGECAGGVQQCVNGALTCTKNPSPEICDNKDNDCNGLKDEGDPGGGMKCGTDQGECMAGVMRCVANTGMLQCVGAVGGTMAPFGTPEICDGKDNDCDGNFDEGLTNLGACGVKTCINSSNPGAICTQNSQCPGGTCAANVGTCMQSTLSCQGGGVVCGPPAPVGPTFEACDTKDNNCNGVVDEGYNLNTDPQNCGACGTVCDLSAQHANAGCSNVPPPAHCTVASCKAGYHDNDGIVANGCEFGPCFITSGVDFCDGLDNDCDGVIDEDKGAPPAICQTAGECAGTVATCDGVNGWRCHYGATVSTQTMPTANNTIIIPETLCDTKDNDCDLKTDEGQPNLGQACHDAAIGVCQATGTFICDGANLNGPAKCNLTTPGQSPSAEKCDNLDNNCNGQIDEGGTTGSLNGVNGSGQEWVTIFGAVQIMKYEASRPDSNGTTAGSVQTIACSKQGALPWTNLTYPQAVAACSSIGARLCTEAEWQGACDVTGHVTYPIAGPTGAADHVFIEAEDAQANVAVAGRTWSFDQIGAYSGNNDLRSLPNAGSSITNTNAIAQSPRLEFQVNFQQTGNHCVWLRMWADTGNDNSVFVDINAATPHQPANTQTQVATTLAWTWVASQAFNIAATGNQFVDVYMREDGTRVDAISISKDCTNPPAVGTNVWGYGANPRTAQPQTCNDNEYDTDGNAANGDQDDILPTGSLASCFANGPGTNDAFDMSGNVKEWTSARAAGQNPIRGGASNTPVNGTTCELNFTLADDAFFFPNVGFRCCR